MSFILDALRKVDQEKGPPGRSAPAVSSIEKLEQERHRRRRQYAAMAVIAVVSAGATAAALRMLPKGEAPIEATVLEPASIASAPPMPEPEREVTLLPENPEEGPGALPAPLAEPATTHEARESEPVPEQAEASPAEVETEPERELDTGIEPEPEAEPEAAAGEWEPEPPGTIRVVGQESPTRSIYYQSEEVPEATGANDPPPDFPPLVLQGTSVLDGKPVAVVSDRRVFEGDLIEGATVIRIEERSVELEYQGRRFTVSF
ncbi:MAG: hypothetical protein ACRD3V_03305 [Vicinamibacteria bacterium]